MKNRKYCPKCQSTDIVIIDGYTDPHSGGNSIALGSTIFSMINVDRYICCNCGFTEEWINKEDIEKVKKSKKAHR